MKKLSIPKKYIVLISAFMAVCALLAVSLILSDNTVLQDSEPQAVAMLVAFIIALPVLMLALVIAHRLTKGNKRVTYTMSALIAVVMLVTIVFFAIFMAGGVSIQPQLTFTSGSKEVVYDGTELQLNDAKLTKGRLKQGHRIAIQYTGGRTNAGNSQNSFIISVLDRDDNDVTDKYVVTYLYGTLKVNPLPITISSLSAIKVYDGTPLTCDDYEFVDSGLIGEQDISVTMAGTRTDVGVSDNTFTARIMDGQTDVTSNYLIEKIHGTLEITPRNISIKTGSLHGYYSGEPLVCNEWEYASQTKVLENHTIEVIISGRQTDTGVSQNTVGEVIIRDENKADVTFNYNITFDEGELFVSNKGDGSQAEGLDTSGDIGEGNEFNKDDKETVAARVNSSIGGNIYLRYTSFGGYRGDGWNQAEEYDRLIEDEFGMNYLTGISLQNAGASSSYIAIESRISNYLLPYYLSRQELNYTVQSSDVMFSGDTSQQYNAFYYMYDYLSNPIAGEYNSLEQAYYSFVKQKYLSLGGSTSTQYFTQLASQFDTSSPTIISDVASYIQNAATYNLDYNSGLNKQADIATAFLQTYKQGICVHFASAATLLYRALGYPARYTIGYSKSVEKDEWTEVKGENAHAWVEVYINGLGWVSVEVTAGMNEDTDEPTEKPELIIKPVDVFAKYEKGIELVPINKVTGLDALLVKGYTYDVQISGKRIELGKGKSTITSFTLYDDSGKDVTGEFKIKLDTGTLQLYIAELNLNTPSAAKVYDGTTLTTATHEFTLSEGLLNGHISKITVVGKQTIVGSSANYCNLLITNQSGDNVTDLYRIHKSYGVLTVTVRDITVTAGSASKAYDGIALTCAEYDVGLSMLATGDSVALVGITGSQTEIGRSDNIVTNIKIVNSLGQDVTGCYSIEFFVGRLSIVL